MSEWIREKVGGVVLWGSYYYTGVERAEEPSSPSLQAFLDRLETERGYFVRRFPRAVRFIRCSACGCEQRITMEKEVDTSMVAEMLRLAAVNAFDIMVLVSGDADHAPAVEGVRALGKQVWVATWAGHGLSDRLRKVAFDHIDLRDGLGIFAPIPESPAPEGEPE